MKPPLYILGTLAFLICVNSATIPTKDQTIVVVKAEDNVNEAIATAEMAADEPYASIKLTEMLVKSEVSLRYAHTSVVTNLRNPARWSQQTTFNVLLPDTAFVTGFVMTLSGKSYKAYVKEKEEAKKIYSNAVSQGIGAAHVAVKARNSNQFTVTVNVEPNSKATFNLTYEELLVRRNGVYNHAINLHPGALVPHMEVRVHIKESQKIKLLRVPELRTGNEIDATESDAQNTMAVINRSDDKKEATIIFTPDLQEQKQLARVFAVNLKKTQSHYWSSHISEDNNNAIGQFVVQYDVERPDKGEILVNDGYFVHFFAPQSLSPLSKYVVFVLDTSYSMDGRKIEQLRGAMHAILADLNPNDYFSIVEYNSIVKVHKLNKANSRRNSYYRSKTTVPPFHASPENIAIAQIIVSRLYASGATNIYEALKVALELINKAYENSYKNPQSSNIREVEPVIIFLTDGDPTVGETSTHRIISHMTEKNSNQKKTAIFSLAFGEYADRTFLRKLSLRNDGFMRHIYEAADAELQLRHFYQQVSSPLLAGVNFVYPPNQVKESSVTKNKYKVIYDGSEVVVAGQLGLGVSELEPTVQAFCADTNDHRKKPYEVRPTLISKRVGEFLPLERMWAYLSVMQLLDEREVVDNPKDIEKRALDIALKYAFVTPLTSLVVVKPDATDAVNAESVDNYQSTTNERHAWNINVRGSFDEETDGNNLGDNLQTTDDGNSNGNSWASTPAQSGNILFGDEIEAMTTPVPSSTTTAKQPLELKYHLEGFTWVLSLLNHGEGILEFSSKGKKVTLEVTEDSNPPKATNGDEECSNVVFSKQNRDRASEGDGSVCVYLTRCAAAADLSVPVYRNTYCTVNNRYAGVCCPRHEVDVKKA